MAEDLNICVLQCVAEPAPDVSDYVDGGTTLQGESSQQFGMATKKLVLDTTKAVRMYVRLIGLGSDRLTRREEETVALSTLKPRRFGK